MRLAVLGMGKMGHAIAERLLGGGHDVTVWNRTPHKANDLVAQGAREAATPFGAAEETEATFASLADDAAVWNVVTGQDGVAAGLRRWRPDRREHCVATDHGGARQGGGATAARVADPRRPGRCRLG